MSLLVTMNPLVSNLSIASSTDCKFSGVMRETILSNLVGAVVWGIVVDWPVVVGEGVVVEVEDDVVVVGGVVNGAGVGVGLGVSGKCGAGVSVSTVVGTSL
jgi:hypothetical protein